MAFEGFFAQTYNIGVIQWGLLPWIKWNPVQYHWVGIGLVASGFGWFLVHIIVIERNPPQERKVPKMKRVDTWRNTFRHPFTLVTLGIVMIVLVFIGAVQMILAFNAGDYFDHWRGRAFVFGALIVAFVLIVAERGFDLDKHLRYYVPEIPRNVREEIIHYLSTLSPVERERVIQELVQRFVKGNRREQQK